MAPPSVADRLDHILRSIAAIEGYWAGKSFADFIASEPMRAATERHLLIIAEAVKHIPRAHRDDFVQIPWNDIIGMGNILRHGYDIVDERRIWAVLEAELPALKVAVEAIKSKSSST
jgi:uncharacterized protein with HEPN domain